jgi:hypothetical protein
MKVDFLPLIIGLVLIAMGFFATGWNSPMPSIRPRKNFSVTKAQRVILVVFGMAFLVLAASEYLPKELR